MERLILTNTIEIDNMALITDVVGKEHAACADPLVALLRDPHVRDNIDWGFANGLFHARKVDYIIGRAVDAFVKLADVDAAAAYAIGDMLDQLQRHPQYGRYFKSEPRVPAHPEDMQKNPAYKAIGSFGH